MNRQLRKLHTGFALGLLVCVPLGYSAALLSRPEKTLIQAPAMTWEAQSETATTPIDQVLDGFSELGYEISLRRGLETKETFISMAPSAPNTTPQPDVLVYFLDTKEAPQAGADLPAEVQLLGSLRGDRRELLALPSDAAQSGGHILLYSLAHAELLGSAAFSPWER